MSVRIGNSIVANSVVVDGTLSSSSNNAIANSAVKNAIDGLQTKNIYLTQAEYDDFQIKTVSLPDGDSIVDYDGNLIVDNKANVSGFSSNDVDGGTDAYIVIGLSIIQDEYYETTNSDTLYFRIKVIDNMTKQGIAGSDSCLGIDNGYLISMSNTDGKTEIAPVSTNQYIYFKLSRKISSDRWNASIAYNFDGSNIYQTIGDDFNNFFDAGEDKIRLGIGYFGGTGYLPFLGKVDLGNSYKILIDGTRVNLYTTTKDYDENTLYITTDTKRIYKGTELLTPVISYNSTTETISW